MRPCRGAEALGYGMQSPPARAMADYFLKDHKPSARQGEARLRGLDKDHKPSLSAWKPRRGYGVESWGRGRPRPTARRRRAHPFMEIEHLFRYPAHAVGLKPSARQGDARLRGLTHAVGLKPSARRDEARLRGLERSNCSKTIKPSAIRDDARLRVTRTPTVMLSAINYRLSVIGYRLSAIC